MSPRRTATVAGVLVLGAGMPLVTPTAAHACSCEGESVAGYAADADLVLAGTVRGVSRPWFSPDVVAEVAVDRHYQGDLPDGPVEVRTPDAPGCETPPVPGERWVFFLVRDDDALRTSTCQGTSPATARRTAQVERALGEGDAVEPAPIAPPSAVELGFFGALGLLGLVAVVGVRRRRRAR